MSDQKTEAKSNKISMTLPGVVLAALDALGAPLEMTGQEYLKLQVLMAHQHPDGVHLNLPRMATKVDASQLELFKGEEQP
jgi:hypothetical protein